MSTQTQQAALKIINGRNKLAAKIINKLLIRHNFTESTVERKSINQILASLFGTPLYNTTPLPPQLAAGEPTTNNTNS